jgi:hypothetical protein
MSDEKEGFKVSDRRKFNPDGSPREQSPDTIEPAPVDQTPPVVEQTEPPQPEQPGATAGTDNILSFPGEPKKAKDSEGARPAPAAPAPATSQPTSQKPERQSANEGAAAAYDHASSGHTSRLPAASFLGLANMLGVEAAMHLGLIETGPGEERSLDLDAARHVIDLLGIVQDKTHGNLTNEEETLLDNMLADLRMQFVAASRRR